MPGSQTLIPCRFHGPDVGTHVTEGLGLFSIVPRETCLALRNGGPIGGYVKGVVRKVVMDSY